jgi:starch-binding outer membrane protein SusE/F
MKKIKLSLFIAALGLLLISCDRDITEPVISADPTEPTESDLSFTGTFDMNHTDSLITFSWSAADFGFSSSTTYSLEMSPTSDFSSNVASLFSTQKLKGTAKVGDINTLILSWDYNIGTPVNVYYRVAATIVSSINAIYSNSKSKSFTPFDAVINYPMVYVPGGYQGWSPGAENGRLFSYGFNSRYSNIIRLNDGTSATTEFKITPMPNWDNDWGGTLTASGDNYSGTLVAKGSNMVVNAGTYEIIFDVSALTITLTKTQDWGIIGSAVPPFDWSADVNMFYNGQRKMWEITGDFQAGAFKFRANDGWDVNYGDTGADGTLDTGGTDIALATAGNYTIRFDPVKLTYTVKKN